MRGLAFGIAMVAGANAVLAQDTSGYRLETMDDLVGLCAPEASDPHKDAALGFCHGVIAGSGLLYRELVNAGAIARWTCPDETPSLDEIRTTFLGWAGDNPDYAGRPIDALWSSLAARWPCEG